MNMTEKQLRAMVYNMLVEWFEREVMLGREQYADGYKPRNLQPVEVNASRIRESDPLAEAKRERPELWNTTTEREFVAYDDEGNEVVLMERVSILDVFGPGPSESPKHLSAKPPRGNYINPRLHYSKQEQEEISTRNSYMIRLQRGLHHLDHFAPMYMICLRWYFARMPMEVIAKRLSKVTGERIAKGTVEKWFESALTWLMGCVMENPVWREYEKDFREVLKQHLAELKADRRDTIWGEMA